MVLTRQTKRTVLGLLLLVSLLLYGAGASWHKPDRARSKGGLPADTSTMEDNDNVLDAALCVLAAVDFLRGDAMEPEDQPKAWKEGWIWVREKVER